MHREGGGMGVLPYISDIMMYHHSGYTILTFDHKQGTKFLDFESLSQTGSRNYTVFCEYML